MTIVFLCALNYAATTIQAERKWEKHKEKISSAQTKCTQMFKVEVQSYEK